MIVRISPALLRQSVYGTLKFGAYYGLKQFIEEETVFSNMLCAVAAGKPFRISSQIIP